MFQEILLLHPEKAMCDAFDIAFRGLPNVRIIQGRFEGIDPHDCFVTAGNAFGIMTAGIDAAVVRAFGQSLMDRVQLHIMDAYLGEQPVGTAFIIPTGNSKIPFLAHAPTMRVPGNIAGSDKVYAATWAAFLAIHAHNLQANAAIRTVALPAMGTGFGGMPYDAAARQMAGAYRMYLNPPHRLDWDRAIEVQKAVDSK